MPPKVVKETVVFVTNVGVYVNSELDVEFVNNAKIIMSHIIDKKIFVRPRDEVGIILTGVEFGENEMELESIEDYHNIQVPTFDMIQKVMDIQPTNMEFSNWVDGIRAAVNLIERQSEGSVRTTIIVISDCYDSDELNNNRIEELSNTIVDNEIQLLWLGSKDLTEVPDNKRSPNEKKLFHFCELVVGEYMPFSSVIPKLEFYGTLKTTPTAWKCNLEIGEIKLPVMAYLQIAENFPTKSKWSTVSTKVDPDNDNTQELQRVKRDKALVNRHREEQSVENTTRGYMYGRKFIPLSDEDRKVIKYLSGDKSMKVYGFTREKYMAIDNRCGSKTYIIVPMEGAEKEFCSLVKATADLKCVAVVRRVYGENTMPVMNILYPQISDDGEKPWCFIMHELLYSEEGVIVEPRSYEVILKSLNQEKLNAVDNLIDNMMLRHKVVDEDMDKLYDPGTVHSPELQHVWNVIAKRALNPTAPIPEPAASVLKLIQPPERTNETEIADNVTEIIRIFNITKEPEHKPIDELTSQLTQTVKTKPVSPMKVSADETCAAEDVDIDTWLDD